MKAKSRFMPHEIFTATWAQAWASQLNQNTDYRDAAQDWEWPVVLVMQTDPPNEEQRLYLDLWHGACREARMANAQDLEAVPYIISAPVENWRRILQGEVDPMMALMRGQLKLEKGKLLALARYAKAAKQLVLSATRVATHFPDEEPAHDVPITQKPESRTIPLEFTTTGKSGLRHDIFPMRLYHKAKKLGIWNPQDIDFSRDVLDWQRCDDLERTVLLHLTSLFQAGEEAVTLDLLPLIMTVARERRLEEEMYLTTFLWEEAKHTEFFRRFLDEVAQESGSLSHFHTPGYREFFYEELPSAMNALLVDPSPAAQIRAAVTYNMIAEGMLAETGYHAYYTMLERNHVMPGLRRGVALLKRDEARHIAYGIYLLSRLISADSSLWKILEGHMARLMEPALAMIHELFACYEVMPFGLQLDDFLNYALQQFNLRLARLERAQGKSLEQIEQENDEGAG